MAATSSAGTSNFGGDLRHAPMSAVETALPDEWNLCIPATDLSSYTKSGNADV